MTSATGDSSLKEAKDSTSSVTLDDILIKFSLSGRYYVKLLFLLVLGFSANSMYSYNYVFTVEKTEYRCKRSVSLCNVSPSNGTVSGVNDLDPRCYERISHDEQIDCAYANNSEVVSCSEWVYDKPDSYVAEFQLACQDWKAAFVGTAHCIGYMFGLPFIGSLSDRFGRKITFIITAVMGSVFGIAKSFAYCYWLYIFFEMSEAFIGDLCSACFMFVVEMVATEDRPIFLMFTSMGFTAGHVLATAAAWYFRYWRNFVRVIYAPSVLFLTYICLLDESPRWLLTKGRKQEAIEVLKKIAKANHMSLDKAELDNLKSEDKTESNIDYKTLLKSTFQSKILLKRFLVAVVWWTSGTFVNYGIAVNSVLLSGNKYVNFLLIYLIDIPMVVIMAYVLKYYKRKIPLMFCFFGAFMFFIVHPFIPTAGSPWLSLLFFIGGKCMSTLFFGITYVFTSELFPTSTRNSMHALCSSIGRIGSIVAQQTPLLIVYWHGLPSTLMAAMALLASLVTVLVPDTADDDLPDTVGEAENIGMHGEKKFKTRL